MRLRRLRRVRRLRSGRKGGGFQVHSLTVHRSPFLAHRFHRQSDFQVLFVSVARYWSFVWVPLVYGFREALHVHASHQLHGGQVHVFGNKVRHHLHEGAEHLFLQKPQVHQSPVYRYPLSPGVHHGGYFAYQRFRGAFGLANRYLGGPQHLHHAGVAIAWSLLYHFHHLSQYPHVHILGKPNWLVDLVGW